MTINVEQEACFQLKASFMPCTVLHIKRFNLNELEHQLQATIRQAPNLFTGSPVAIELDKANPEGTFDFVELKRILLKNGLVPIGVRGGSEEQREAAMLDGFPLLATSKSAVSQPIKKKKDEQTQNQYSKLITTPVRSGMQIYAKEGDLIVTASVSPGAELFADGNIHVYGNLRGRAFAGTQGNMHARIFCRTLEAELVSIAGYYLTKEDMRAPSNQNGMVQIYLENAQVRIEAV